MNEIEKYFRIIKKIRSGIQPSDDELMFYYSYTPQINQEKINEYVEAQRKASKDPQNFTVDPDLTADAVIEVGRMLQSDPVYKEQTLRIAQETEAGKRSDKLAEGINFVLAGTDIANSVNQIRQAKQSLKRSKRPSRPAIPQRDIYLEQALRQGEENIMDAARATAPVQQQIQDQYLEDVQNAKIASTGQAGAYGAYRQLAANRRNRAAMNLAPIQDEIRRGQQQRYDNLLGMRMDETQQQFRNQAYLYPYDLEQYNADQKAAASLGSTGRLNLRDSLYNIGGQAANYVGRNSIQRKYDKLRNQALVQGLDPETIVKAEQQVQGYINPGTYEWYGQMYGY